MDSKKIFEEVLKACKKLNDSRDPLYTKEIVPVKKGKQFSIECERMGKNENLYDEDGELIVNNEGASIGIEIYYQDGEQDIDVCSVSPWIDDRETASIFGFVNCWV